MRLIATEYIYVRGKIKKQKNDGQTQDKTKKPPKSITLKK